MAFPGEVMTGGMGLSKELVAGAAGTFGAVKTAMSAFKRVNQGEMGVRTRLGKVKTDKQGVPRVVGAGLHAVAPFTHSIETIAIKDRAHNLEVIEFEREETKYTAKSSITWAVSPEPEHLYRAIFEVDNLTESVTNICVSGLYLALNSMKSEKMHDPAAVRGEIHDLCDDDLLEYGVVLRAFRLHSLAAADPSVSSSGMVRAAKIIAGHDDKPGAALAALIPQAAAGA